MTVEQLNTFDPDIAQAAWACRRADFLPGIKRIVDSILINDGDSVSVSQVANTALNYGYDYGEGAWGAMLLVSRGAYTTDSEGKLIRWPTHH